MSKKKKIKDLDLVALIENENIYFEDINELDQYFDEIDSLKVE